MVKVVEQITTSKWFYIYSIICVILVTVGLIAKFGHWKLPVLHDIKEEVMD